MRKQIAERPDAVVEALLKSPRGVEVLLAHAAGIFSEPASRKEPTLIILQSAFAAESWRLKPGHWLQLLRERNLRQLEAELEVHAKDAKEAQDEAVRRLD